MKSAPQPSPPRRLRLNCPQCGVKLAVEHEHLGRNVRCPGCANLIFLAPGKHPDLDSASDGDALKLQVAARAALDETATPQVICTFEDRPGEYAVGSSHSAASPAPSGQAPPGASLTSEVVWHDKRQQPAEFRLAEPAADARPVTRPPTEAERAAPAAAQGAPQPRLTYVAHYDLLSDPYASPNPPREAAAAGPNPGEPAAAAGTISAPASGPGAPGGLFNVPLSMDAALPAEPQRAADAGYGLSEPPARSRPLSQLPPQPPLTADPLIVEPVATPAAPGPSGVPAPAASDSFNMLCPLCGTLIDCLHSQVGQRVTCPDCHSQVAVRGPRAAAAQSPPRAPSGAYAVSTDRADTSQPAARPQAPALIPVVCRVCGTRVHATPEQVGQQISCPDCHTLAPVLPPQEEPARAAPAEAAPYALGAAPVRVLQPPPPPPPPPEEEEDEDSDEASGSAPAPSAAAWWSVADLRAFVLRAEALHFIVISSFYFGLAQFFFALGSWLAERIPLLPTPIVGTPAALALLGAVAHAATALQAIVSSSGSGGDEVEQWPAFRPSEWLMPLLHVLFHAALAMALAGMFVALLGLCLPSALRLILFVGGGSLIFSFTYMSSLEEDSLLTPFANETRRCVEKMPLAWLVVAGVATAGGAATIAVAQAVAWVSPFLAAWVSAPLIPLTLVLYGRSLGRLIWSYAERRRKRKKKRKPFRPPPPPDPATDPFLNPQA